MKPTLALFSSRLHPLLIILMLMIPVLSSAQTAPVNPPTGGFAIDGNLTANIPTVGIGDWIPGNPGAGGFVMSVGGVVVNPARTAHVVDAWNGGDDVFTSSHQFNDDPNTWTWGTGGTQNKTDINNALFHFTTNGANNHTWFIFGADRYTTNGSSYIDFEFLQNTMTKVGVGSGTFNSTGPNGGRTVNDFLFSAEYTNGGSAINFFFYKWAQVSPGVYDYVAFTPAVGTAFGFTSAGGEVVPYGAFGGTTYISNQFVEGAVDLDAVISNITTCTGILVHTFMVKTKGATPPSTPLADFVAPLQLNLSIGFTATASAITNPSCNGGCNGSATLTINGGNPAYAYTWSTSPVQHGLTASNLCAGTYTVSVTDSRPCTVTSTVTITSPTVLNVTTVTVTPPSCFGGCNGTISSTPSGGTAPYTYTWTPGNQHGVTASGLCAGTYALTVSDQNGCTAIHSNIVVTQPTAISTGTSASSVSCNGGNNGSVCSNPIGGTPGYAYFWNPSSQTVSCASNLTAGTYTVTVTDSRGCTATGTATVTEPPPLTLTTSQTNESCNGGSNATASASASGGSPLYSYTWLTSPTQTGPTATGLTAGTYTVIVNDSRGCNTFQVVTITQPTPVTGFASIISNVSCNGACDGIAYVSGGGGTPGYSYSWSPGGSSVQTLSNLCAGPYFVNVFDTNGCLAQSNVIAISQPQPLTSSASSIDSVNCFGGSDGAIILSTNGGTAPYSYNWSPSGGPGDTASNLVAGCYTALITDQHGCTTSDTLCVQQPTQLLSSVSSQTDVSCNGGNNGIAVVGASGGSPQYTFSWSGSPSTTDTASNLTAGSYTATITDQNGCSTTQAITITEPTALNLQGSSSNSTCTQSNGSAWIVVTGGTGGYTYLWSAGGQQGQTATSLSAAIYTVTVTDANGCTAVDFVQVSDAGGPITNATAISDVSCSGDSTGSAWVSVSSGTPPFTYSWSPTGGNSDTATGLTANTYFITVTDSNGCVSIDTVSITQPPALVSSIGSSGNVICNGQGNGTATVTVNGGSPAYTYSWSNGDTTATISGLSPNIYTVTVTDALGCLTVSTDTITEPATLITVTDSIHNVGCHGESSGNIYTSTSGGTLGYTFSWTPPGLPATPNLIGISAGIYTLLVTDSNGCTSSITDTVTEPAIIVPLITAIQLNGFEIKCNGDSNGVAYVDTVFGGTFPYTYTWSTGSNNDTIYNLHPGQYSIVVYDQNGCSADTFITLTEPLPISLQDTLANVTCSNSCDGFIAIDTVFGGVGSYTYNWSPVSSTLDSIGGLCAGSYTVTVTDLNGCTMQAITDITQPNPIVIGATFSDFNTYNISCNGASDGCIDITALGGTGTLYIIWTPTGDTTFTICGLSADTPYTAHITDDNGCILDTTFILTEPPAVNGSLSSSPNLCNGDSTGTAWATVSGGVTPYTYLWTPTGQTGSTASGLTSGTYTATITDANGCSSIISVSVTQPNALSATTSTTDALCNGGATGTATANASGGVGAYTYSWNTSPVQTIQTAINLPAGCYTVLVTDANGCTTTQVACVTEPTALSATTSTTDVLCNSDTTGTATVNPSGGVSPYTFNWDTSPIQNGQTATGLAQGTYTIVVTDQNGCNYFTTAVVTEPPPVSAIISTTDVLCNGGSTGTASVIASGGVAGYIYLWNPGLQTGTTANGLTVGCYTVTVTDANGCTVTQTACVAEPNAVTVTATSTPAICNGGSTGTATAAASGGVGGYVYVWNTSPPQMSQTATSLSNGTYVVVVTDANNCSSSTSVLVAQPAPITTDAGPYQIICGSSTTLNAQLNVGQNGYWNVQIGSAIFSPDTIVPNAQVSGLQYGGNVLLWSITDANGCTASDTVSILAYEDVQAVAGSPDTTICQAAFTSYELTAANPAAGTGIWSVSGNNGNPNGIADSTALSTQYTSAIAGANIILWTVTNGPCRNQDTVIITIKTDGECLNLELPSGYTPNGDGYNDSYIIHGLEGYPENTFIVFNRWGNEVFKKDNYKNNGYSADWFGQNNQGDPLPDGTYYVILKIKNSSLAKNTYVDLRR